MIDQHGKAPLTVRLESEDRVPESKKAVQQFHMPLAYFSMIIIIIIVASQSVHSFDM